MGEIVERMYGSLPNLGQERLLLWKKITELKGGNGGCLDQADIFGGNFQKEKTVVRKGSDSARYCH